MALKKIYFLLLSWSLLVAALFLPGLVNLNIIDITPDTGHKILERINLFANLVAADNILVRVVGPQHA